MYQADSLSLKRSKRNTGVMRYEFELTTIDMDLKQGRRHMAKLSAAVDDTLGFVHPRLSYTEGIEPAGGIDVSNATMTLGGKDIWLESPTSWSLYAGDYIQFGNDSKVYQLASDAELGTGAKPLTLTQGLRKIPDVGSSVTVNGVIWYLTSNGVIEASMEASDGQDIQLTLVAVEKL